MARVRESWISVSLFPIQLEDHDAIRLITMRLSSLLWYRTNRMSGYYGARRGCVPYFTCRRHRQDTLSHGQPPPSIRYKEGNMSDQGSCAEADLHVSSFSRLSASFCFVLRACGVRSGAKPRLYLQLSEEIDHDHPVQERIKYRVSVCMRVWFGIIQLLILHGETRSASRSIFI